MVRIRNEFDSLVEALAPELFRYALLLCQNHATAEDLVQETFLRGWRSRADLRDLGAARTWFYTILRNEHARLYERRRPESWDPQALPEPAAPTYDTSTEAFNLRRALGTLDPEYREPLLLQVIGGFSCREIGEILDLKLNTVLTRLFRARKTLRERLSGETPKEVRR
jgi:RNA polymerase sigma-70 factor (ECF subfamily)